MKGHVFVVTLDHYERSIQGIFFNLEEAKEFEKKIYQEQEFNRDTQIEIYPFKGENTTITFFDKKEFYVKMNANGSGLKIEDKGIPDELFEDSSPTFKTVYREYKPGMELPKELVEVEIIVFKKVLAKDENEALNKVYKKLGWK